MGKLRYRIEIENKYKAEQEANSLLEEIKKISEEIEGNVYPVIVNIN